MLLLQLQKTIRPGEHNEFLDRIKAQVRCFDQNTDVQVYEQLEKLREYLQYRIDEREYTEKMAAAKLNFEEFRRNHVEDALRKFDRAEKERDEELKWSWSPLYQLLKKWP